MKAPRRDGTPRPPSTSRLGRIHLGRVTLAALFLAAAGLYGVMAEDVLKIIEFDPAHAVKITMRRAWGSGAVGEGDVYGAQQHVPLMEHAVPWEDA